jgi:hypothetical protein
MMYHILYREINNLCLTLYVYFNSFVPVAKQAGQVVVPCRLSLNMCLWVVQ